MAGGSTRFGSVRFGSVVGEMAGWRRGRRSYSGGGRGRRHLLLVLAVAVAVAVCGEALVVVKCPQIAPKNSTMASYCSCSKQRSKLTIKCDFGGYEAVQLTRDLMAPFLNTTLTSTYVRLVNATSVHITSSFMQAWHEAPSAALDVWHGGNLTLESTPEATAPSKLSAFKTFAGVGIVSCNITSVPSKFLRDRTRGGFRIKDSSVDTIRAGFLHRIEQMRYIVLEKSVVGVVEGSVASEGYVTLSKRHVHTWNGLSLINSTFTTVGAGAFNLTHQSDMESVEVRGCRVGRVGTGGLVAAGDIAVTIKDNVFSRLDRRAFKVEVTGPVNFDRNVIGSWAGDALEGFMCHNRTSLESNTILVDSPLDVVLNQSTTPFHTSCGNPQIFLIITPEHPLALIVNTTGAWALGGVLFVVVVVGAVLGARLLRGQSVGYGVGLERRFPILLNGRENKTSLENLPNHVELNQDEEEAEEAVQMEMTAEREGEAEYEKPSMVTLEDLY